MKDLMNRETGDLFEDAINELFRPVYFEKKGNMKTDIKETDKDYELDIEMPGFKKEDINVTFNDGYLNVEAKKEQKHEEGCEKHGNYIRRERSYAVSRSYYVGDAVKENIKAKYENGLLNLIVPKEEPKKIENSKILID